MLTDYHLHLRPDEDETTFERYFTAANAERYRAAADAAGIEELGVSEHVYRFRQSLDLWSHPLWVENANDDLDEYCEFVRSTSLRLGVECDFVPGAEERTAGDARGARLRLRRRLGPLHRRGRRRRRPRRLRRLGAARRLRRGDLDALLRALRPLRPLRPLRHPRPPGPGQGLGQAAGRCRRATCGASTSPRSKRSSPAARRSSSPPRASASRSVSSTRRANSPSWWSRPGVPFALSSDAHLPEQVGFGYDRRGRVPRRARGGGDRRLREAAAADRAARRPGRLSAAMIGIGYDSPPLRRRPQARPRRGRDRPPAGARGPLRRRRRHPRGDRRDPRRRAAAATSARSSRPRRRSGAAPTRSTCCAPRSGRSPARDRQRRRDA